MTRNSKRTAVHRTNAAPNRLRIIAGRWRGVPITFPSVADVRPTPDRVRETVFNWLQPSIVGANCLDLFAGSGALGFEALSRGARGVVFVDRHPELAQHVKDTAAKLRAEGVDVVNSEALRFLAGSPRPFDLVFLDPPYASGMLTEVCARLAQGWLAPGALIYLEALAEGGLPVLPMNWSLLRSKSAGQVGYHLLRAT